MNIKLNYGKRHKHNRNRIHIIMKHSFPLFPHVLLSSRITCVKWDIVSVIVQKKVVNGNGEGSTHLKVKIGKSERHCSWLPFWRLIGNEDSGPLFSPFSVTTSLVQ